MKMGAKMPYKVSFEGPDTGTHMRREWASEAKPPPTVDVVFTPESSSQELQGSPTRSFVDPKPGAGNRLIARVATPATSGRTENYTLTITEVGVRRSKKVTIQVVWH